MTVIGSPSAARSPYPVQAYQFIFEALRYTQEVLGRQAHDIDESDSGHISGPELLEGIRRLALKNYGLLAKTVFTQWGIRTTGDFGRIVFDLIERGEMRKTEHDRLEDFFNGFDFEQALIQEYDIDTESAF